jgi:aconitate hydratase
MEFFGKPGKTLLGSDSHTCAGGALGMLAIGAGGLEVAMAMAGHPFSVNMPQVLGVQLRGKMPDWVSAKDIILEMLRRRGVKGGVGCVIEYDGPGLKHLNAWDRHVIANMGAELGATGTVFPSDKETLAFLRSHGREQDWIELKADKGSTYDWHEVIDLSQLEPLVALPSSPDKVVPVRDVAGRTLFQSYIGSSANPGYRDFAIAALMVKDKQINGSVSFDINPASRNSLEELASNGLLATLIHAGARIHQAGCNGCIGMGQAPATGKNSLRTVPRNFPGRSGTKEDSVYLCSPETATASALRGVMTDPRDLGVSYPKVKTLKKKKMNPSMMQPPLLVEAARQVKLIKGPNIASIPVLTPLASTLKAVVLLKMGDNISTDEILPAGARVLPFRSNIPKISEFAFDRIDETYAKRASVARDAGKLHAVVAGENYGQGSSREHAALAPRYLGLQLVIAKSFARIHEANLVNFGVLPLTFVQAEDYQHLKLDAVILIPDVITAMKQGQTITALLETTQLEIKLKHHLSARQIEILEVGGLINWVKRGVR